MRLKLNPQTSMKPKITKSTNCALLGSVLLCVAGTVAAQAQSTFITFSVDMATNIANGSFNPPPGGTDAVNVRGTYNGWAAAQTPLVQVGSSTVYTNTVNDTTDPNGGVVAYIFNINGSTYETVADFNNRAARLPLTSGASLVLPTPFFGDAGPKVTNDFTFQVDMSQQIHLGNFTNNGAQIVEVRGNFNGWIGGANLLTNDPTILRTNQFGLVTSNVFVGTVSVSASTNATMDYKFVYDPPTNSYEGVSPVNADSGGNRFFTVNPSQRLALVDYGDAPFAPVAQVTFNVDMSIVVLTDTNFNPSSLTINGDVMGWGGVTVTNNPSAPNTNIYSMGFAIGAGTTANYQYRYTLKTSPTTIVYDHLNGANGGNANRTYLVPNVASTNLPAVFFNDASLDDYLTQPTPVLFSVDMNGAVGTDTHVFNPASDALYINGQFANWYAWAGGINPAGAPPGYLMVEQGLSTIYTNTIVLPAGTPVAFNYKYGMDFTSAGGPADDEAGFGQNHYRVVRATKFDPYPMPTDTFGNQYNEPFFNAGARGGANLSVGPASGGTVAVSWLGRPGAHLQAKSDLGSGDWQDLWATDGTNWTAGPFNPTNGFVSVTNWPASGKTFFRLSKPN
jgi:hypothetical protein